MKPKRRLLIVDDDLDIRTQLMWALEEDFELLVAGDPQEAGEILDGKAPPDAALVDLHLPPDPSTCAAGLALIRRLRQSSSLVRIIAISAQHSRELERRSRSAGAVTLLGKPVQRATLLELLHPDGIAPGAAPGEES